MTEPKTVHLWMPDGRSLCDRRASPRRLNVEQLTDDEFGSYLAEQIDAPVCGSCVNLADFLRLQAIANMVGSNGRVHPPAVKEGWTQLRGTRWEAKIDFDNFLSQDFSKDRYDSIFYKAADERIREGVDVANRGFEKLRQARKNAKTGKGNGD
ncbi:hypothetical protein NJB18091_29500 [Mycobacterium marinum]|uniref:Uncharacterized protein n=1 Tax=Mycobacterium marinum (strain ATCC BAA-535 / M) TaxID=216594 RepID=B2HEH5_MYCMM|nr:hypothetical protein [Mycobacterium marinum]ACC43000.1 hypothetical protein MMAR_4597 [Mycobacterium marinum M]GJN99264.1 hypothetical protein NJB18091_29500 [Mycobacterium marinum]GJO18813.1 hypothetical protein NJB1507_11120 [Mycobacterium marinum]